MGRELRRVPPNWEHPEGTCLYDDSYEDAKSRWDKARSLFEHGLDDDVKPLPNEALFTTFEKWNGEAPDATSYRPKWSDEERTHYQMYETCSEGTPISPVLESPEQVAKWCADNGASAFGDMKAPYVWWLRVCQGSAGFGIMLNMETKIICPI